MTVVQLLIQRQDVVNRDSHLLRKYDSKKREQEDKKIRICKEDNTKFEISSIFTCLANADTACHRTRRARPRLYQAN